MRRLAVIGLGMAAAPHARSLLDLSAEVEVVAAYSPTVERQEKFAKAYGLPVTGDLDAIYSDRSIDAVMLLTPPNTHLDLVRRAADTSKHVLLEKPIEIDMSRAVALVETVEEAGIVLGIVLQHRFKPAAEVLGATLASGRLGAIVSASARIANWRPQSYYDQPGRGTRVRDGGGVLLTQAIHTLDLLISLAGLPVEVSALARTTPVHRMETEDLAAAVVRFESGAIGTISATTCAYPGFPDTIEIVGAKGTATLAGEALDMRLHDGTSLTHGAADAGGTGADPMAFGYHLHRAVLADFLAAIAKGGRPRVDGREALMVHRLIDAILASSDSGQRVEP